MEGDYSFFFESIYFVVALPRQDSDRLDGVDVGIRQ